MPQRIWRTHLDDSAAAVYAWHLRPGAFQRLTPPWERITLVSGAGGLTPGSEVVLRTRVGPVAVGWTARHTALEPGRSFTDEQHGGPFARWVHQHRFEADPAGGCWLEDEVTYRLPAGSLGSLVAGGYVRRRLDRLFAYRHAVTVGDLAAHRATSGEPLRIALTGGSGLLGRALAAFLTTGGHTVLRLVRGAATGPDERAWDPVAGTIDAAGLEGLDAVIHLAGESLAAGRWTAARKERIRTSREAGTRLLATTLAALQRPPRVLLSASAVGYYGPGEAPVDEAAGPGDDFLAAVCQAWEAAAEPARAAGIRVVHPRLGVVLTAAGGALPRMLPPFLAGLGGRLGSGRQAVPWIALDDVLGGLLHALRDEALAGPVNFVAPQAVTNGELTAILGRVLHRPTICPVPAAALRLVLGEMADALLLTGRPVVPSRLTATGYAFRHPTLEGALRHELGRPTAA